MISLRAVAVLIVAIAAGHAAAVSIILDGSTSSCMTFQIENVRSAGALRLKYKSNLTDEPFMSDLVVTLKPPESSRADNLVYKIDRRRRNEWFSVRIVPLPDPAVPYSYIYGLYQYCFAVQKSGFIAHFFTNIVEEVIVTFEIEPLEDAMRAHKKLTQGDDVTDRTVLRPDQEGLVEVEKPRSGTTERHRLRRQHASSSQSLGGDSKEEAPVQHQNVQTYSAQLDLTRRLLQEVRTEAEEIISREKAFRSTSESTFTRVWGFSLGTMGVIAGVAMFVNRMLKRVMKAKKIA